MSSKFDVGLILLSWTVPNNDINMPIDNMMAKIGIKFWSAVGKTINMMITGGPGMSQVGEGESTALEVHR